MLLQVNKKMEADAAAIGGLCPALSPTQVGARSWADARGRGVSANALDVRPQVVKILSLYTPVTEFEERVSPAFIAAVEVSSSGSNTIGGTFFNPSDTFRFPYFRRL